MKYKKLGVSSGIRCSARQTCDLYFKIYLAQQCPSEFLIYIGGWDYQPFISKYKNVWFLQPEAPINCTEDMEVGGLPAL